MEARFYEKTDDNAVRCRLCRHQCMIAEGKRGLCSVRENRGGVLESLVYGKLIARHVDPIEKKPLYHVAPGTLSYSIATVGCNFRCRFCQNADIAQMPVDQGGRIFGEEVTPRDVVEDALHHRCRSIAYTYTEPTVFFEFALDTAMLAKEKGLLNLFVTNGYMSAAALAVIHPFLDAANVDLKAFSEEFYRRTCGAALKEVKDSLVTMKQRGIFIEVTTLIIPGLNDADEELNALAGFLARELGPDTPWHISRFHPTYRLTDRPTTPVDTLVRARDIGVQNGLRYVYTGNVPGHEGENTYCHRCGETVIGRWGYRIEKINLENGCCRQCGAEITGLALRPHS